MEKHIVNFFKDLYKSNGGDVDPIDIEVSNRMLEKLKAELMKEFTPDEIKQVLMQMHPWKASRLDGMQAGFYQRFWDVIEKEVIDMALNFLNEKCFLDRINQTNIALIPKVKNPTKITKFYPISLCNVSYKIIAKTLANRFQKVLPFIIDESYSAFMKGRLIMDNVIVAFELFHWLKTHKEEHEMNIALKIDMNKAFDRVNWSFL